MTEPKKHAPRKPAEYGAPLSVREHEILVLTCEGLSKAEIGKRLFVEENTVKTHWYRLSIKLGARGRANAVAIAFRTGILRADPPVDEEAVA